jgi:hypothetical protein
MEEYQQYWEEQYKIVREFPKEKRQLAVDFLRTLFSTEDLLEFYDAMKFYEKDWLVNIETEFHLHGGIEIRNELREAGFGEDYFGVGLDYVYVGLIEEAILGNGIRVTKDEVKK